MGIQYQFWHFFLSSSNRKVTNCRNLRLCSDDNDNVAVSDVGSDDLVDPSLNIDDTEKKIERSRRTSKMENKAVTKQKLLRRMASQETVTKEQGHSTDTTTQIVSYHFFLPLSLVISGVKLYSFNTI